MSSKSINALKGVLMPLVGKSITWDEQDITALWVDDVIHDITLMVSHGIATFIDVNFRSEDNSSTLATYHVEADDITYPDSIDSNMAQYLKNQKGILHIDATYLNGKKPEFPPGMKKDWENDLSGCSFRMLGWVCP